MSKFTSFLFGKFGFHTMLLFNTLLTMLWDLHLTSEDPPPVGLNIFSIITIVSATCCYKLWRFAWNHTEHAQFISINDEKELVMTGFGFLEALNIVLKFFYWWIVYLVVIIGVKFIALFQKFSLSAYTTLCRWQCVEVRCY